MTNSLLHMHLLLTVVRDICQISLIGRGVFNPFNSFSVDFSYVQENAIIYITFDRSSSAKSKKTLLIVGETVIEPNNQTEIHKYLQCNEVRESVVYEGMLDLSKEGKTTNLSGLVIVRNAGTAYLNLSGGIY